MKWHPFRGFYLANYQGFGLGEENSDEQLNKCHLFTLSTFICLVKKTLMEMQIH